MKKITIMIILFVILAVTAEAQYDGCVRKGMRTDKYTKMNDIEFKEACKNIKNYERVGRHMIKMVLLQQTRHFQEE